MCGVCIKWSSSTVFLSSAQELSPPLVDDFLYLCDDAYNRDQILSMEREVLLVLGYDINVPVAYRFIRRLARVSSLPFPLFILIFWSLWTLP